MSRQLRSLLRLGAAVLTTLGCARPAADARGNSQRTQAGAVPQIRLAEDSFAVRFQGLAEGAQTLSMTATDSGYRYVERLTLAPVLVRVVEVDLDAALRVRHARSETRMGARSGASDIRYAEGRARGTATPLMAQAAGTVRIDTVLPVGAFDGLALYPLLLARRWTVGQVDTLTIWDADELTVTRQTVRIAGAERVQTPAGDFEVLRAELSTTQLPVTLWLSVAVPHRLVKVGSANGETVLVR